MAVVPTGEIFKTLTFDGQSSGDYGVYITGEAVYNAPARDVEMVTIPGRNGQLALDKGRFENIEVSYPAGIFADNEADFAQAVSDFRNFLASRSGYCRLEDDYNPNEYRMAVYKSGLEVDPKLLRAGEFDIVFNCKPQRWLKDGETAVTIGEWGETETASGDIVTVENENGGLVVKSLGVDIEPIQSLNGYDKPWVGGAGKNKANIDDSENGGIDANGQNVTDANNWRSKSLIPIKSGQAYTLHAIGMAPTRLYFYDANGDFISPRTVSQTNTVTATSPSNAKYVKWTIYKMGITIADVQSAKVQLEEGSTATAYEPYSNICPISGHDSVALTRTGKNLLKNKGLSNTVHGVTFTFNTDGTVTVNGTADALYDRPVNSGFLLPVGTYIFSGGADGTGDTNMFIFARKKNGSIQYVTLRNDTPKTFNVTDDVTSMGCSIRVNANQTYQNAIFKPMIRLASDTDATYEPYQGTTYTTDLGRAVYGGTLDVTSGVLTVTHLCKTLTTADFNISYVSAASDANSYYYNITNAFSSGEIVNDASGRSNIFKWYRTLYSDHSIEGVTGQGAYVSVRVNSSRVADTSSDALKAYLPATWQVYAKLDTPQTYQLTAQQIELLTGTNNIWSDSGDVTVEYGQNPSILVNPTLFESSPLLRIWGYGTVGFNGYEIELENDVLGNIVLLDAQTRAVAGTSTKLPKNLMNAGDSFTLDASSFFWAFSFDRTRIANVNIRSVSDSDSSRFRSEKAGDGYYTNVSPLDFVYGTESTISNISTIQATYTDRDDHTGTFTLRLVTQIRYYAESGYLAYTRNISELPGSWLSMDYKSNLSTRGQVVGDSTVSVLGSPTIIDCDLGEAYKYAGSPISLNRYVDLGSDLPILAPGKNEITYDDTITQLRIVPNWWKI